MTSIQAIIDSIQPLNQTYYRQAREYCDSLAKPLGAMGKMEDIYCALFAMFCGKIDISKKIVTVYVADNGICEEGISSNPQVTTYQVGKNMLEGKAGINIMSAHAKTDVAIVDIGCLQDLESPAKWKVMSGTKNALKEPAMTRLQAEQAIRIGYDYTKQLMTKGYTVFGTGEMGVGNTTTSVAVICALLGQNAKQIVGTGAGITEETLIHKAQVITDMLSKHQPFGDAIEVAQKVGGLDILGMVGTYLACAQAKYPIVIDGLISIAALLVAQSLNPYVTDYAFASHHSSEPAYQVVSEALQLDALVHMNMRLGEGTGCPLAFFLLDNAVYTMQFMPTFQEAKLKKEDYVDNRK